MSLGDYYRQVQAQTGASTAPVTKAPNRQWDNIAGLDLGLNELGQIVGGTIPGIANLVTHPTTMGPKFLKGLVGSLAGTGATLLGADLPGIGRWSPGSLLERGAEAALGQPVNTFGESVQQNGLLPGLLEHVGNAALVGGVGAGVAKLGEIGTAAKALEAPSLMEKGILTAAEGSKWAVKGAEAAKAAEEAGLPALDAAQVAQRARTLGHWEAVAHPYKTMWNQGVRPLGYKAQQMAREASVASSAVSDVPGALDPAETLAEPAALAQSVPEATQAAAPKEGASTGARQRVVADIAARQVVDETLPSVRAAGEQGLPGPAAADVQGAVVDRAAELHAQLAAKQAEAVTQVGDVMDYSAAAEYLIKRRNAELPAWVDRVWSRIPPSVQRGLETLGNRLEAHDITRMARDLARLQEGAQRIARVHPASLEAQNAAKVLKGEVYPDLHLGEVSRLVGEEVGGRADLTAIFTEEMLGHWRDNMAIPPEQIAAAEDAARRAYKGIDTETVRKTVAARAEKEALATGAPGTDAVAHGQAVANDVVARLNTHLNAAVEQYKLLKQETLTTLLAGRKGVKGFEAELLGHMDGGLTPHQLGIFKHVTRQMKIATNLENKAGLKQLEALAKERLSAESDLHNLASKVEEIGKNPDLIVQAETAGKARPLGLTAYNKPATVKAIFDAGAIPDGGITYDVGAAREATEGGWAVGVKKVASGDTGIDAAAWTPAKVTELLDANAETLAHPDARVGIWHNPETGKIDFDISMHTHNGKPLTRGQAVILGMANDEVAIFSLDSFSTVNLPRDAANRTIALQLVGDALDPRSGYNRWANELETALDSLPKMDPVQMEHIMPLQMVMAWQHALTHPGQTVGDYFKQVMVDVGKRRPKNPNALFEEAAKEARRSLLGPEVFTTSGFKRIHANAKVYEKMLDWYHDSNKLVEQMRHNPDGSPRMVTLMNGTQRNAADVMYDLIAVTSIQAKPVQNLGSAYRAMVNYITFQNAHGDRWFAEAQKIFDEQFKLPAGFTGANDAARGGSPKLLSAGTQEMLQGTNRLPMSSQLVMDVLAGKIDIGNLTLDDIVAYHERWNAKKVTFARDEALSTPIAKKTIRQRRGSDFKDMMGGPEEYAMMEAFGSPAWAKLRSFRQNLANPGDAMPVTLDMWMERGHGVTGWGGRGTPKKYLPGAGNSATGDIATVATQYRELAAALSKGKYFPGQVQPHQIQALLWAHIMDLWEGSGLSGKMGGYTEDKGLNFLELAQGKNTGAKLQNAAKLAADHGVNIGVDMTPHLPPATLFDQFANEIRGAMLPIGGTGRLVTRLFETGDFATLLHENAHVLRTLLSDQQMQVLERAYLGGRKWGDVAASDPAAWRTAEEAFVNDFFRVMLPEAKAKGAETATNAMAKALGTPAREATRSTRFPQLDATLGALGEQLRMTYDEGRFASGQAPLEVDDLLTAVLNPDTGKLPTEGILSKALPALPEQGTTGTLRQRVASLRPRKGESATAFAERLRLGNEALLENERRVSNQRALRTRMAAIDKRVKQIDQTIETKDVAAYRAARLTRKNAMGELRRLQTQMGKSAKKAPVPAWEPLTEAITALQKIAQDDPSGPFAAAMLEGDLMGPAFETAIRWAAEKGVLPTHVNDMTWGRAQNLLFGNVRLGKGALGQETEAGTRTARTGALHRLGLADRTIETLMAGHLQATHELYSNALVDIIERQVARPLPKGGAIPEGWVSWEPQRQYLLSGEKASEGVMKEVTTARTMIPSAVAHALDTMSKDYSHWSWRMIARPTSLWRNFVLTLSPKWYVNNFFGNTLMATAEGVKLQDWVAAWRSYRGELVHGRKVRFVDVPEIHSQSMFVGEHGLLGQPAGSLLKHEGGPISRTRAALSQGDSRVTVGAEAAGSIRRINEGFDEIARAAVFNHHLRTGATRAQALQRSFEALVDYGNMSPFERSVIRGVVPFYAWQKGIFKLVATFPSDHPIATALLFRLGELNTEMLQDRMGIPSIPQGYSGLVDLPVVGWTNMRAINPFQDSAQLITPEGIASAMNPFIKQLLNVGMHAPPGGYPKEGYTLDQQGNVVPNVTLQGGMNEMIQGLPQTRFIAQNVAGGDAYKQSPGTVASIERFSGFPPRTYSAAEMQALIERLQGGAKRAVG